ncbi:MAG: hypothetical protein M4579_006451 [Chaenotheca gracillima]|nr:MAG: hypothetical protein M4579_006451 [Chaenotheca gracillima]
MAVFIPLVLSALGLANSATAVPTTSSRSAVAGWQGFDKISYIFSFGDSYTTTGFNVTMEQPCPSNPFGNPPYPGYTSSNGPNWIDFLTTTYNQSFIETINLAYGGATVDSDLVAQYLPTVLDLRQQVNEEFLPYYAAKDKTVDIPWKSDNSLFSFFFGINDVGNSYSTGINKTLNDAIFAEYAKQVDVTYQAGARNFLFLNVPPVNRAPLTTGTNDTSIEELEEQDIEAFNNGLTALAKNLTTTYADAVVFEFNTNLAFTLVLGNPDLYPQTENLRNTTGYCVAYENGTDEPDSFDPSCGVAVNEFFWLNTLHPTYPMQNVTAEQVSKLLDGSSTQFTVAL